MSRDVGRRISVCLLTYNHADAIGETLRSVLDQDIDGFEVVVSDDCSTDGTWEKVLEFASGDGRIIAVRTPKNIGMAANANFAVSHSSRPYVALLHHDDLYRADMLEKWATALDRNPDAGFVFNPYGTFNSDSVQQVAIPGERVDGEWLLKEHLFRTWGCCVRGTAMIRREAWHRIGGMRERFGLLADIDMWMRLAMLGPVAYVPEPVITVRHQRPDYYPDIYTGKSWSWLRQRLLYEVHAENLLAYLDRRSIQGRLNWLTFRWRLSIETTKWLLYSIVRRKREMIKTCGESATPYDLNFLRALRHFIQLCYRTGRSTEI